MLGEAREQAKELKLKYEENGEIIANLNTKLAEQDDII